jgi:hypothetical protein
MIIIVQIVCKILIVRVKMMIILNDDHGGDGDDYDDGYDHRC